MNASGSRRPALAFFALTALAVGAVGCASSTPPAAAPSSTAATAGTTGGVSSSGPTATIGASPTSAQVAVGAAIDVCSVLPASLVAQITGSAVSSATADDTPPLGLFGCDYATDLDLLQISIQTVGPKAAYDFELKSLTDAGQNPSLVSGTGDGAFTAGPRDRLVVLYGDGLIKIVGPTTVTVDQAKQLSEDLHAKI